LKDRLTDALRASRADYTEIRLERTWASAIAFRGSRLEGATSALEVGGMVRCLNRGKGWGIASFTGAERIPAMVAQAHELSLAVPLDTPIRLADIPIRQADHVSDLDGDVREIPLNEKRALLERLNQEMLATDRRIIDTLASYDDRVTERWIANSDGLLLYDIRPEVRLAAGAVAREESFLERAFESWSGRAGWRGVQEIDHLFRQAARRALTLLGAPRVRAGTYPVVLDHRLASALVHQTLGHLSEADALARQPDADEFMRPGRKVGSDLMTVGDDGSASSLTGSFAFDDEGAPTQNILLVQHGVLVGRLHTRETAARAGVRPTGSARAGSFSSVPEARLSNTYLANGRGSLDDLLRGIPLGIYCCDAMGGEARLGRFSITAGWGQMIRDGKLAETVKPMVLAGSLVDTLHRVDGIAGDFRWSHLASGCSQQGSGRISVAEGAPHIRIDGVSVGGDTT
jgi:TldD protein